jgi:tetratricopeptide (TPR) repeat protein
MFEFGRELKRLFQPDAPRDGLTGGDASLLELLPLDMLRAEGRAADIAAGRISAKDRSERQLEAAGIWRELARRTGDVAALRKAASAAELAAKGFERETRPQGWARARCEQARAALLGAALFGDDGLNAAAEVALIEAQKAAGAAPSAAMAAAGRALIDARKALGEADRERVLAVAAAFDGPIGILQAYGRRRAIGRLLASGASADRAELLTASGLRLQDPMLLRMALDGLAQTLSRLDPAYEPLSWASAAMRRGSARVALADLDGDLAEIAEAVNDLVGVLEHITRDHSPLDWAHAQQALAQALQGLAEATDCDRAFDQAVGCYDRALTVFETQPTLIDGAAAAYNRAVCLARRAEILGDLGELAKAETALRADLAASNPAKDPVSWAVRQLNFARLYEARANITGRDRGEGEAAAQALAAALEVFGEHGLRSLTDTAAASLERIRSTRARRQARHR